MKKSLTILACLFAFQYASAQQLPYYTQFRNYQSLINPGSVHSDFFLYDYNTSVQANYRAQWITQDETPRTAHLSGEFISNFGNSFELLSGLMLLNDRTGPYSVTGVFGRIGSIFAEDPYFGGFSVGIGAGAVQYRIDADRIVWAQPDDPNIPELDVSVTKADLSLGAFYYKRLSGGFFDEDNIYAGISMPQLLGTIAEIYTPTRKVTLYRVPHLYGTVGWYHFLNEEAFVEVSGWFKRVEGAPINVDLTARFQPVRTFWAGGGFNFNGIVHLEAGLNIPELFHENANVKIGYAFDYNISAFNVPFGTSHELTVALMFDTVR
ncbi:MAG: PorP/SprF family type IX secretion system membrane protein [Saprospiraceae bacterium]|jgi:type IX secretion system PorP/SprF family membrane protein|nr:PorP/SprF family type IX secretion system membrane protein [Saprospiraceae bacterium]